MNSNRTLPENCQNCVKKKVRITLGCAFYEFGYNVNEHPLIPISFLRIFLSLQSLELNSTCRIKCFLSRAPPREQTRLSILTMLHLLPVPSWLFERLDDQ